jgi:hypothetical protein
LYHSMLRVVSDNAGHPVLAKFTELEESQLGLSFLAATRLRRH